jgi:hypothetical protein
METDTMRFIVFVKATPETEAGILPTAEAFAEMDKFNEEMVRAGVVLAGEGLHPSSKGARIKFTAPGKTTVIDGPFAETKEIIAGYGLWQVKSKEEAIEWVKRAPFGGGQEVEIRQVFDPADFADIATPEMREADARFRSQQ